MGACKAAGLRDAKPFAPQTRTHLTQLPLALLLLFCMNAEGFGSAEDQEFQKRMEGTANDFFARGQQYEEQLNFIQSLRTYKAGVRLLPTDERFRGRLRRLSTMLRATVSVEHEGRKHTLPVFIPDKAKPVRPSEPGSADSMVAEFFRWRDIPIFRNDSDKCAIHVGKDTDQSLFTVMGHTCLSSLYASTHNKVQAIIRGEPYQETQTAIPTQSNISCGITCGVHVPVGHPPFDNTPFFPSASAPLRPTLWEGEIQGHRISMGRAETLNDALSRLSPETEEQKQQMKSELQSKLLEDLLARRPAYLDMLKPYFHISQALGDRVSNHDQALGVTRMEPAVSATVLWGSTGAKEWNILDNQIIPTELDEDAEAAQKYLEAQQSPADCSARKALVYHFDRAYWGFAANVHFMTVALNHALAMNRTFVTRNPDHWNYGGRDCKAGWECYFQPVSKCREKDVWEPYTLPVRADFRWDHRGFLYRLDTLEERVIYYSNVDGPWQEAIGNSRSQSGEPVRLWIPPQFRHRSLLWWRAQLTRYLFRPKRFVVDFISERMASLGLTAPDGPKRKVVSLHVRRGDKAYDMYQGCYFGNIDTYVEKAKALVPDMSAIYVSTDDPSVIDGLPQTQAKHGIATIHDPLERRYNGTHIYAPQGISIARWPAFPGNDPKVNTTMYALETIKSIWILALSTEAFVGTVTSSMSRLIYQLRVGFGAAEVKDEWTVDKDARHPPGWFADP